jgi:hypothetical protein
MMKTHSSAVFINDTRGVKFTESPPWHDAKRWCLDIHDQRNKAPERVVRATVPRL